MSKKKRQTKKYLKRAEARRKKKAVRQAAWASRRGSEENRKSKRTSSRAQRRGQKHTHAQGHCGNVGCARCNPNAGNTPGLASPGTPQYQKRWTSRGGL